MTNCAMFGCKEIHAVFRKAVEQIKIRARKINKNPQREWCKTVTIYSDSATTGVDRISVAQPQLSVEEIKIILLRQESRYTIALVGGHTILTAEERSSY